MGNLGEYIRQQRQAKHMTIDELSNQTKISVAVLNDIENGKFDRYKGDEAYVKMYLKKITRVLEMDSEDVANQYLELTREIELEDLKEKEDVQHHNEEVVSKGKKFSFESPQFARKPSVYEDKSHVKIIQTIIILALVCLVVVVIWYGLYSTRSKSENPKFVEPNTSSVEGDVETKPEDENKSNQNPSDDNQNTPSQQEVTLTRDEKSTSTNIYFKMNVPEEVEKLTLRLEFSQPVWAQLRVNGKSYPDFEEKVYHEDETKTDPEVVNLEIPVADFENMRLRLGNFGEGQHYYINDVEIPLTDQDYTQNPINVHVELEK